MERYESILAEKMIMQAMYSKSIVEIKTWIDMNDILQTQGLQLTGRKLVGRNCQLYVPRL